MSTLTTTACRDLTCAVGATLITLMQSVTLLESTAVTPRMRATTAPVLSREPLHHWIGEPEPAVLVD